MPIEFKRTWNDPDLESYRDSVARFVESTVLPGDEEARKRGHVGHHVWRAAGELGFLCTDIPEVYGGAGGDFRHEAVFQEELARRGLTGMNTAVHSIVAHYLLSHGTEEQKTTYLPRLVLVVCKTDPTQRSRGMSILILETEGLPGYRVGRVLDKMGLKAQDTSELFFDEVTVPADRLLGGEEGRGMQQLIQDLPYERLLIAVMGLAMMEGGYAATLQYVQERKAFDQRLLDFQNTRFKLAEVATQIRVGRAFVDRCIEELVQGTLDTTTASMAKLWVSDTQNRVLDELLQLWGGYGYMNEYPISRMYTDARVQRIYGGTNEIMKEVIARSLA